MPKMVQHVRGLLATVSGPGGAASGGEEEPVRVPVLAGGQAGSGGGQEGPVRLSLGASRQAQRIRFPFRAGGQAQVIVSHLYLSIYDHSFMSVW